MTIFILDFAIMVVPKFENFIRIYICTYKMLAVLEMFKNFFPF